MMVKKVRYTSLIIVVLFGLNVHAQSTQLTCIGRGDDPSQDFYGRKLNNIIDYTNKDDKKLDDLKKRNAEINRSIENLTKVTIPRLQERFEKSDGIVNDLLHKEILMTQASFDQQRLRNEAARRDKDRQAELRLQSETARLSQLERNIHLAFETWQRERIELVRKAQLDHEREMQAISVKKQQTEQKFEQAQGILISRYSNELRRLTNSRTNPNYDESETNRLNARHQASLRTLASNKQKEMTAHTANEDASRRKMRTALEAISKRNDSEKKKYEEALLANKEQLEGAQTAHSGAISGNNDEYRRKSSGEFKRHQERLSRYRNNLDEARQNILREIERTNEQIANLEKERDQNINGKPLPKNVSQADFEREPEKYLDYHGIKQIEENKEKFKFIAQWWSEQGSKNDRMVEGQPCTDCDEPLGKIGQIGDFLNIPKLKVYCVQKSIEIKKAHTDELMCNDSKSSNGVTKNICVTKRMADYTQWALNNALECLSSPTDPIDPQVLFKKLNNESTFRFFHAYNGGQGLMQTITCAQDEVMGMSPSPYCGARNVQTQFRSQARKDLARVMDANASKCGDYSSIFNFKQEAKYDRLAETARGINQRGNLTGRDYRLLGELADLKSEYPDYNNRLFDASQEHSCDFVSLQSGIHRNILSGLGLFLNYRSIADNDLQEFFGAGVKNHPQYKKIRDLAALVYYGPTGPSGAKADLGKLAPSIKAAFPNLNKMKPSDFENKLRERFTYIRAIHRSEESINSRIDEDKIQCVE